MGLMEEQMVRCVMIDKRTISDGRGGYDTVYVDGATFQAVIALDTSTQAKIAEQQGVTSLYKVITPKNVNLQYHDVFKRLSDNKIFRVTSDGDDKVTPNSASMQLRKVTAEQYTLPQTTAESFLGDNNG